MKSNANLRAGFIDVVAMLIIAVFGGLSFLTTATIESFGSDTSIYYELAKSLLNERTYSFNYEPHTIYPPGFPALLAFVILFLGDSFAVLVKGMLATYVLSLIGIYYLVRRLRGPETAFAALVLIATSYVFYFFSTTGLYSEGPYLLTSVYALLFFEIGVKSEQKWVRLFSFILVSVLAAYLLLVRSIGIAFLLGLLLWMLNPIKCVLEGSANTLMHRVRILSPFLVVPILAVVAWTTWCTQNRVEGRSADYMSSYATQLLKKDPHQIDSPNISLGDIPSRVFSMADIRLKNAARMLFNMPSRSLTWVNPVFLIFVLVLIIGFFSALIEEGKLVDYYVLSYAGVLLTWPFDEGTRFLVPLQPFLILYAINGIERLIDVLESERLRRFYIALVTLFATVTIYTVVEVYLRKRMSGNDMVSLVSGALLCSYFLYLRFRKSERLVGIEKPSNIRAAPRYRHPSFPTARAAFFVTIVLLGVYHMYGASLRNLRPDPSTFLHAPTVKVSNWIAQNTRENDIVMLDEYAILHRLTKRKTLRFPLVTDPDRIREKIIEKGVDYLVIFNEKKYEYYNPSTVRRFETVKTLIPNMFIPEHDFGQGMIYRVIRVDGRARIQS
jgi:hypothetical protein